MSQIYTDPKRESDPHALPDAEVFQAYVTECRECEVGDCLPIGEQIGDAECSECGRRTMRVTDTKLQWYWQSCFPGCLPDSEPVGPFATEAEAIADAQDGCDDE